MTNERAVGQIDVEYVSELARLELSAEEKARFQRQLEEIVHYVRLLEEADTSNVEPSPYPSDIKNVFRDDAIKRVEMQEWAASNAPRWHNSLFIVPPIIS